ncbi:MAG: hypothetical protein KAU20_02185 [Nanoarchaeota archaeon]|nr:hypothetical protein [Nanoarchaeota archaeon]
MKKIICLAMFFVLISSVYAEQVYIVNFNYDNGLIMIKDKIVKQGYYPDRKLQPEEGYKCSIMDHNKNELYSFIFDLPIKIYTDGFDNLTDKVTGGVIRLNQTDFAFIIPYFEEAGMIKCYNTGGYEIVSEEMNRVMMGPEKKDVILFLYLFLAIVGLMIVIYISRKRRLSQLNQ